MVTLQDISTQLMRPAKDLADWKFPLGQILEEYYALLEEPCNINFGEAALVLQNSANVYVRRIECLLNETEILKQIFYGCKEDEIKSSICKENILKKTYIDFENFIVIDIEKHIGKHLEKKHPSYTQRKSKLLSHRFTQLENNLTKLCIPIPIFNVLGEIIGTKSDFRCNQAISISGMLVDELIPCNVTGIHSSYIQEGRALLSSYTALKTPCTGTSDYHSVASPNDNESMVLVSEEFEERFSTVQNMSPTNVLEFIEENIMHENCRILFMNTNNSNENMIKDDILEQQYDEQCIMQNIKDRRNKANLIKKAQQSSDFSQINQINQGHQNMWNNDNNLVQLEGLCYVHFDYISKKDQIFQLNRLNNIQWKEGLSSIWKRGNHTRKISMCSVNDINESDWKPMSLIQGMEHVFRHNLPILKTPNYISVLKAQFNSKKRKYTKRLCKPECITKLILREAKLFEAKDRVLHTKKKFRHLQTPELEDFIKDFDKCFCGTKKENSNYRYEAVTDIVIDLLDLGMAQNQTNSVEDRIENIMCRKSSPAYIRLESIISQNSLHITGTPSKEINSCHESSFSEISFAYSLSDYQTLIEGKMKEIFEESNVTTELDQTVAKWHASLEPKLSEAEIRPVFRIYDYAYHIIRTLQTLEQKKISFDSVVQDKPAREVARYFLASLQLANTYSVEIMAGSGGNSIEITLLNNGLNCDERERKK